MHESVQINNYGYWLINSSTDEQKYISRVRWHRWHFA